MPSERGTVKARRTRTIANMTKSVNTSFSSPSLSTIIFILIVAPLALYFAINSSFRTSTIGTTQTPSQLVPTLDQASPPNAHEQSRPRCNFSVVFNKPPKTASSFVVSMLRSWSSQVNRTFTNCRGERAVESNMYLTDCIPRHDDGCFTFGTHFYLTENTVQFFHRRLPTVRFLTSTRYPPHRIFSLYLEINNANFSSSPPSDAKSDWIDRDFQRYLLNDFNPWSMYNYHTGENRFGRCPLTEADKKDIFLMASRYDIVVNANLVNESNEILSHFGLFQFPQPSASKRVQYRGATTFIPSANSTRLINTVSCVEDELHHALLLRMASLHEFITDRECISHGTIHSVSTCFEERERQLLASSWLA